MIPLSRHGMVSDETSEQGGTSSPGHHAVCHETPRREFSMIRWLAALSLLLSTGCATPAMVCFPHPLAPESQEKAPVLYWCHKVLAVDE